MSFLPANLAGSDLVWLLDVDWLGRSLRLSEQHRRAPFGEHHAMVDYLPGLDMGGSVDQVLDLFADASSLPSVSVTLNLAGIVDVPAEIAAGRDFSAATGVLSLWAEGDSTEDSYRIVVVSGRFRAPEYGSAAEPITATLEEFPATEPDLIPDFRERVNDDTWADHAEPAALMWYPQILGSPGAGETYGSAALFVDTNASGNKHLLIAGHAVQAASVGVLNATDGTDDSAVAVEHQTDGSGRTVAMLDCAGFNEGLTTDDDAAYWIKWPADAGGHADHDGGAISGAGSVLRWLLERSSLRWDRGRLAAILPALNAYRVDCAIQAAPDRRVDPWAYIQQHLLPILPITPAHATTSGGLAFVLWRFDALAGDAIAHLRADRAEVQRQTAVSFSDIDGIANEYRLAYAFNADTGKPTKDYTLSGDELVIAGGASSNNYCRVSAGRYGSRVREDSSEIIYDDPTAAKVCGWWSRAFALASRSVSYSAPSSFGYLELGDPVLLTDAEISFSSQLCLVSAIRWMSGRSMEITLRAIEDPARDPRTL